MTLTLSNTKIINIYPALKKLTVLMSSIVKYSMVIPM